MRKLLLVLFSVMIGININSEAEDFFAVNDGDTIYFNITSSTSPLTVAVTYRGTFPGDYSNEYSGAVSIPDSVLYGGNYYRVNAIGVSAFSVCAALTSVIIPNSVTSFGYGAFENCPGLTSILIPSSVNSIGDGAFFGCYGLTSITSYPTTPPSITQLTFNNVNKSIPLYVPCASVAAYQNAAFWNEFTNYVGVITAKYISDTIYSNQTYTNYGANINTSGNYTLLDGCDTVKLTLIVNPIYNDTIIAEICSNETYTLNGFNTSTAGFYTQNLQTIKGCDSVVNLSLTVIELSVPTNLSIINIANYIKLDWVGNGDEYIIYKNNDSVFTTSANTFIDSNVVDDTNYCYKIKAIKSNCESDLSAEVCLIFSSIDEIQIGNIIANLYLNPTQGKVKLEIEGLNSEADVMVYDMIGKVILRHKISKGVNELEIDLSGYAKGIYSIRILSDNINISKKVVLY